MNTLTGQCAKQSEVETALKSLGEIHERINAQINELASRLSPILRPESPSPAVPLEKLKSSDVQSPFFSEHEVKVRGIQASLEDLRAIIRRIEL